MAGNKDLKLKLVYLMSIFLEETDNDHKLTMPEILSMLKERYGVSAERKSIYLDVQLLRKYGLDIVGEKKNRKFFYYLQNRDFELSELYLITEAIRAYDGISEEKAAELVEKITGFGSKYQAEKLKNGEYDPNETEEEGETLDDPEPSEPEAPLIGETYSIYPAGTSAIETSSQEHMI